MNLQDIINAAPDLKGARKLQANEPAQKGDRFLYPQVAKMLGYADSELSFDIISPVLDDESCAIRIGWTLKESAAAWTKARGHDDTFDGVIYRPL